VKILDSDHCVELLRGRLQLSDHVGPSTALAVTSVTVGELTHGAAKSMRRRESLARLEVLLSCARALPFDEQAARIFGLHKARLELEGAVIADLDLQIASIAIAHELPLVTPNPRHFSRIPGLRLEDWIS